jgi:hypothetical protein
MGSMATQGQYMGSMGSMATQGQYMGSMGSMATQGQYMGSMATQGQYIPTRFRIHLGSITGHMADRLWPSAHPPPAR